MKAASLAFDVDEVVRVMLLKSLAPLSVIGSRGTDYVPQGQASRSVTVGEEPPAVIREEGG